MIVDELLTLTYLLFVNIFVVLHITCNSKQIVCDGKEDKNVEMLLSVAQNIKNLFNHFV